MTAPSTQSAHAESRRPWDFSPLAKKYREEAGGAMYAMQWIPRLEQIIHDRGLPIAMRLNAAYDRFANGHLSHFMVDGMPPLKPGDRKPNPIPQAKLCEILGEPASTVSLAVKALREHRLAQPPSADGYLYTEHSVHESLFCEQRQNPPVSPLDMSKDPRSEDPLLEWKTFEKYWFDANPDAAAEVRALEAERDEFRRQAKERSEKIEAIRRRPLKAWQRYQRNGASNSANGAMHGAQNGSGPAGPPPEAAPTWSAEQNVQDSTQPEEVKSSDINEAADVISNRETVTSSSSGGNATKGATTTHVQTPPTEQPAAGTHSRPPDAQPEAFAVPTPDTRLMTDREFHQALSVAFRAAGKPVTTPGQSAACYVDVGARKAPAFLAWLEKPYRPGERPLPAKLLGVQHPGVLPSLVAEFESWRAAEPPATPPPTQEVLQARQREEENAVLEREYDQFRQAAAEGVLGQLSDAAREAARQEKTEFLRREGRLQRIAPDVREREVTDLILQDLARDQVMPFAEWVEQKRKRGASP